jgi:molybdate transport system substrate-binding protein
LTNNDKTVRILAAGSLRRAFAAVATAYPATAPDTRLLLRHGPAGLLREEIEAGVDFDVFASADLGHPQTLAAAGLATNVRPFARNRLVATLRADLALDPAGLIATLLAPDVRLATSTPGADPSGDYAERFFDKVEMAFPGKGSALRAKALRLVGGRHTPPVPEGRAAAAWLIAEGRADILLGYASHSAANRTEGGVKVVPLPTELAPDIVYGLCLAPKAGAAAALFIQFLLSRTGQAILADNGFRPADG